MSLICLPCWRLLGRCVSLSLALLLVGCSDESSPGADGGLAVDGPSTLDRGSVDLGAPDRGAPAEGGLPDRGAVDLAGADAAAPCSGPASGLTGKALLSWIVACVRSNASEAVRRGALATFVQQAAETGGFPLQSGASRIFVYIRAAAFDLDDDKNTAEDYAPDRRKGPIAVAGEFNAWSVTGHPMSEEPLGLFHREIPLNLSAGKRLAYKLVARDAAGAAVWFSDPLSRRFGFDQYGRYSLVQGGQDAAGKTPGHLEWIRPLTATKLGSSRPIYLYLPPGYDQSPQQRYPVLYLHDGNNLFDAAQVAANGSWELDAVADAEIAAGRVAPFIGVGIPNSAARMDEYTHVQDTFSSGGKPVTVGGKGDDYLDFVVKQVKPLVDRRYRTQKAFAQTAILGSSLGGLISYYAGLKHPTTFKYVGGMSSTFGWGRFGQKNPTMEQLYQQTANLKARGQVYYLDSGDNPNNKTNPPVCPNPNVEAEDNYCETVSFRDMLVKKGINTFPKNPDAVPLSPQNIDIYHYYQPDAPHNEAAWRARLFRPLRLFFRP